MFRTIPRRPGRVRLAGRGDVAVAVVSHRCFRLRATEPRELTAADLAGRSSELDRERGGGREAVGRAGDGASPVVSWTIASSDRRTTPRVLASPAGECWPLRRHDARAPPERYDPSRTRGARAGPGTAGLREPPAGARGCGEHLAALCPLVLESRDLPAESPQTTSLDSDDFEKWRDSRALTGSGGWTRTNDLRLMKPPL